MYKLNQSSIFPLLKEAEKYINTRQFTFFMYLRRLIIIMWHIGFQSDLPQDLPVIEGDTADDKNEVNKY